MNDISSNRPLLSMHNIVRDVSRPKEVTKRLLSDINWQLLDGQRVGVISSSMNEAHAFLECAAGVVSVQKGEVQINANVSWPIGARGGLMNNLTGRENASLLQGVYGHGGERTQDLNTIAALADLDEGFFDKPLKVYNKLMRSRFYLAVALAFDFDVFIIPKTFAWKTNTRSERLLNLQQALRSRTAGKSLLMTHTDFAFLEQFCEEGIVLHQGTIIFNGTFDQCRNWYLANIKQSPADDAADAGSEEDDADRISNQEQDDGMGLNDDLW